MPYKYKQYWVSPYLKDLRDQGKLTGEQMAMMLDKYVMLYKDMKKKFKAIERARMMHAYLDNLISQIFKDHPTERACKKGCSYCCHVDVEITWDEAALLLETKEPDWAKVERQNSGEKLQYRERACVFLGEGGACTVYNERPMACRKYFVTGDPEHCNADKNPSNDVLVVALREPEVFASGMMTAGNVGKMPEMLLKVKRFLNR